MTSISHLGHFPFCVKKIAEDGEPFEAWDEATYASPAFFPTIKLPSKTASSLVTVYGPHTPYPVGFTLAELMEIFWRCKRFDLSVDGSISVTSPAITANGGYYTGDDPPVWVATSATAPEISLTASNVGPAYMQGDYTFAFSGAGTEQPDPPKHKVCLAGPFSGTRWNAYDSSDILVGSHPNYPAILFRFGESVADSNADSAEGSYARNSASVSISLNMLLSWDVIFAEDKYWPRFSSYSGLDAIFVDVERGSTARNPSGPETGVNDFRNARYETFYKLDGDFSVKIISTPIPFEITLSGENTIAFTVGTWRAEDENYDASLIPSMPTFKIVCTKWWEYGGIYDESTGLPIPSP